MACSPTQKKGQVILLTLPRPRSLRTNSTFSLPSNYQADDYTFLFDFRS